MPQRPQLTDELVEAALGVGKVAHRAAAAWGMNGGEGVKDAWIPST